MTSRKRIFKTRYSPKKIPPITRAKISKLSYNLKQLPIKKIVKM